MAGKKSLTTRRTELFFLAVQLKHYFLHLLRSVRQLESNPRPLIQEKEKRETVEQNLSEILQAVEVPALEASDPVAGPEFCHLAEVEILFGVNRFVAEINHLVKDEGFRTQSILIKKKFICSTGLPLARTR